MEKHFYYVSLDLGKVHASKIDPAANYFEIQMTKEQAQSLQSLIDSYHAHDAKPGPLSQNPASEAKGKEHRKTTNNEIQEIYTRIYQHGTPETKEAIESMKIGEELKMDH